MKTEVLAPSFPTQAEVDYRIEVKFRFNVTAFVACQNVNVYLLTNVGNMLSAGEPTLSLGERPCWKVPVFCAYPEFRRRERIGELLVDADSGAILLEQSFPSSAKEIESRAEAIYRTLASLPARA
jgi:hypothetical protein